MRLNEFDKLIEIKSGDDLIIINPHLSKWYFTRTEGGLILKMLKRGFSFFDISKKFNIAEKEIRYFFSDLKISLFSPLKVIKKSNNKEIIGCSIYVTDDCNMQCLYCRYSCNKGDKNNLDIESFKKYIKEAKGKGATSLTITGGEPIIQWKKCQKIIAYSKKQGLNVNFLTNGSLVTRNIAKELHNYHVKVQVSIDSLDKKKFKILRNYDLEKVIRGIKNLIEHKVEIAFSVVPTKYNYEEIDKIIKFAIDIGVKTIHFPLLEKGERAEKNWKDLSLSNGEMIKFFSKLIKKYFEQGLREKILLSDFENIIKEIINPSVAKSCKAGLGVSALSSNGGIYPCVNLVKNNFFCLGNITETNLNDALKKFKYFKKLFTIDEIPECYKCEVRWLCRGGCRDRSMLYYGGLYYPDPWCQVLKWLFIKLLFITANLIEQNKIIST